MIDDTVVCSLSSVSTSGRNTAFFPTSNSPKNTVSTDPLRDKPLENSDEIEQTKVLKTSSALGIDTFDALDSCISDLHCNQKTSLPPISQILYLTQLSIIVILDIFCLLKLSFLRLENKNKNCEIDNQECQDTSFYMSFLSSTLGYLIPPPRLPENLDWQQQQQQQKQQQQQQQLQQVNVLQASSASDGPCQKTKTRQNISELSEEVLNSTESVSEDLADGAHLAVHTTQSNSIKVLETTEDTISKNFTTNSVWVCFGCACKSDIFVFFSQIVLVFILILFSVARLLLATSLSCEEKTAYTMILSTCIAYLLPNADSSYNRSLRG